jgi:hypothetical protein
MTTRQVGGSMVDYEGGAGGFTDMETGETSRCELVPTPESINVGWRTRRTDVLDDAVIDLRLQYEDRRTICHLWESVPGRPVAEHRRLELGITGHFEALNCPRPSPDAKWFVAREGDWKTEGNEWWLVSLADGSGKRLGSSSNSPRFLPDSSLLVFPQPGRFLLLDLATGEWRDPVILPSSFQDNQETLSFGTPPSKPTIMTVRGRTSGTIVVVDVANGTATTVFPPPSAEGKETRDHRVIWFNGERLLIQKQCPYELWTVNADGTNCRQVWP